MRSFKSELAYGGLGFLRNQPHLKKRWLSSDVLCSVLNRVNNIQPGHANTIKTADIGRALKRLIGGDTTLNIEDLTTANKLGIYCFKKRFAEKDQTAYSFCSPNKLPKCSSPSRINLEVLHHEPVNYNTRSKVQVNITSKKM